MLDALAADANVETAATTAQSPANQIPPELSAEGMMKDNMLILGMLFFIFYFILIRPQQKRLKIQRELMKSLKKGDKVMTTGGIMGTIVKLENDDVVQLEIAQGVKIRMARASVSEVVNDKPSGESANDN